MLIGQYEAAKVLGYGKTQTFVKIILPQVIKRILPSVTNEVITLVKTRRLRFPLLMQRCFHRQRHWHFTEEHDPVCGDQAIFYYVFNYVVAFIMEFLRKR